MTGNKASKQGGGAAGGKRPSIRDLQIDRPRSDSMKRRRMPGGVQPDTASRYRHKRRTSLKWWMLATVLFIVMTAVTMPVVFSDTKIKITPVVTKAVFENAVFNALPDTSSIESAAGLKYRKVEWVADDSVLLESTGREQVEQKASGVITVYNNYTTQKQRLIKNTRFETPDGRVYRVRNSIMVPGKTDDGPGTLDVTVYADEAGERYNLDSSDFTLPGLKSLPDMYSTIYAKVKTPITGGFKGERAVVSEDDKSKAIDELKSKLSATILSEVDSRIPADYIYFNNSVNIEFGDIQESEISGKIKVTQSANVQVITFDKRGFALTISQGVAGNPDKGYPELRDTTTLQVALESEDTQDNEEAAREDTSGAVKLLINGKADFVWMFDEESLKRDLSGKQRDALLTILTGYPTIKEADAVFRPFWRKKFPNNIDDFTIEILTPES